MSTQTNPVGKTKGAGWEIGARRTYPVVSEQAWNYLFSSEGIRTWLGEVKPETLESGKEFTTSDGLEGKITVFKPNSHIRMKWHPRHWDNVSSVQIRVIPSGEKTTISFHQEKMADEDQRKTMKIYWSNILNQLSREFSS